MEAGRPQPLIYLVPRAQGRNWLLHRLSGLVLVLGMVIHFWTLHFANGGEVTYQEVMRRLSTPLWKGIDTVLLGVCLYHALLGIRLVLMDFRPLRRYQAIIVWALLGLGILLFFFGLQIIVALPQVT